MKELVNYVADTPVTEEDEFTHSRWGLRDAVGILLGAFLGYLSLGGW